MKLTKLPYMLTLLVSVEMKTIAVEINNNIRSISEPLKLKSVEAEYNMDTLKEIRVTNSYLGLDQNVRGCQNDEPLFNCTTRHLIENMVKQCNCLPFNLKLAHNIGKVERRAIHN